MILKTIFAELKMIKFLLLSLAILYPSCLFSNEAKSQNLSGCMNTSFVKFNTTDDFSIISYPDRWAIFKFNNDGRIEDILPMNLNYEFNGISGFYDNISYPRTEIANNGKYLIFDIFVYSFDERKIIDTLESKSFTKQFLSNENKILYTMTDDEYGQRVLVRDFINKSTDTIYTSSKQGVSVNPYLVNTTSFDQIVFWSLSSHYYYNPQTGILKKLGESKHRSHFKYDMITVSPNKEFAIFCRYSQDDGPSIDFDVYNVASLKKVDSFNGRVHSSYWLSYFDICFSTDSKSFTYFNDYGNIVKRDFLIKKSETFSIPKLFDSDYVGNSKLNTSTNQLFFQSWNNCFIYDLNTSELKPLVVFNSSIHDVVFSSNSKYYLPVQTMVKGYSNDIEFPNYVFETGTNNIVYKLKDRILYYDFYTINNDTSSIPTKVKFVPNYSKIFYLIDKDETGEYNLVVVDLKDENYRRIIPLGKELPTDAVIDTQKMLFYVAFESGHIKQYDYYNGNLKWVSERIDLKSNNQKDYAIHQLIFNDKKNELIAFQDIDFGYSFAIYVIDASTGAKITNSSTIVQTKNNKWHYNVNRHQVFKLSKDGKYIYYPTDEYPDSKLARIELPVKDQVEPVVPKIYDGIEFEYNSAPFSIANDGKRCVNYRAEDGTILIWDIATEEIIDSIIVSPIMMYQPFFSTKVKMPSIMSWRLSPDERYLVFSNDIGILYIYDIENKIMSVNEFAQERKILELFPNPTRDILHIRTYELIARAELSDLLGNVVIRDLTPTLSKGEGVSLNIEGLPAGMYFLKLFTMSGEVLVEKVIVGL